MGPDVADDPIGRGITRELQQRSSLQIPLGDIRILRNEADKIQAGLQDIGLKLFFLTPDAV